MDDDSSSCGKSDSTNSYNDHDSKRQNNVRSSNISRDGRNVRYEPVSMDRRGSTVGEDDDYDDASSPSHPSNDWKVFLSFWMLGLLNNASYVIMIAAAKNISEGGTALVFLANILPALAVKTSAPYWFDKVSYPTRLKTATCSMIMSFGYVWDGLSNLLLCVYASVLRVKVFVSDFVHFLLVYFSAAS
jgi:hypothetical protein